MQQKHAGGEPWLLPRSASQVSLIRRLRRMPSRLADYGYRVATGQLVWNRHKRQFRDRLDADCHPVLWAEAVRPDGAFRFQAEGREHRPFLHVEDGQDHLLNFEPCVLVQRTTSKEQVRRLIAAVVPNEFVASHAGYIVENHLNMVVPATATPLPLWLVAGLLNSLPADQAFRCISGSVAVSAYELESLPLPEPAQFLAGVKAAKISRAGDVFDRLVARFYARK
jgi:adenine-specific DNA-methyltransferase